MGEPGLVSMWWKSLTMDFPLQDCPRTSDSLGEDTDVAPGLHIIGGLQWEVAEGVPPGVEYKYLKHDLESDDPEVALDIEVDDHLVTGGITFYFRKPFDEILRDLLP
jgi:opacity protein-like surface antigen